MADPLDAIQRWRMHLWHEHERIGEQTCSICDSVLYLDWLMTKRETPEYTPNPGSDEAMALGCTCPRLDNNCGSYPPYPPNGWWMSESCPIHSK